MILSLAEPRGSWPGRMSAANGSVTSPSNRAGGKAFSGGIKPRVAGRVRFTADDQTVDLAAPPQAGEGADLLVHPARLYAVRRTDDDQVFRLGERLVDRLADIGGSRQLFAVAEHRAEPRAHRHAASVVAP